LIRQGSTPVCIGQKQKWFLLQLICDDSDVDVLQSGHPEFDDWRWVSYWYPVRNVVSFKRDVYRRVMKEFSPVALPAYAKNTSKHQRKRKQRRN
jgi:putative (di)nucleoside polyphosphate hydrolase